MWNNVRQWCCLWQDVCLCQLLFTKVEMLSVRGTQNSVRILHSWHLTQQPKAFLLILNSFVSRAAHLRPSLQVWGSVRQTPYVWENKNERGLICRCLLEGLFCFSLIYLNKSLVDIEEILWCFITCIYNPCHERWAIIQLSSAST